MSLPTILRPPLVRPRQGRVLGGVCAGVAVHLGLPVRAVRIAFVATGFAGGLGVALYLWLWALVPSTDATCGPGDLTPASGSVPGPTSGSAPASGSGSRAGSGSGSGSGADVRPEILGGHAGDILVGALLLLGGLAVLGGQLGWPVQLGITLPLLVVAGGAVLAYAQLDEVERQRWTARAGGHGRAALLRIVGGLVLVLLGVLLVVVRGGDLAYVGRVLVAVIAVLGGAGLVLAPWAVRLWRELDREREARVREAERADIAAHLHDSVLQTLALIQRSSDDHVQVVRLARAQERDLRGWLYGARTAGSGTLDGEVRAVVDDVEDRHGVTVEVVVVGDRVLDDRGRVLVAALREAVVNAAKHAGGPVTVYVEAGPDGLEAFVRDRGPGFEQAQVPVDRLGVRESIVGRMHRHGGTATVVSAPGEGTEVRLAMPETVAGHSDTVTDVDRAVDTEADARADAQADARADARADAQAQKELS